MMDEEAQIIQCLSYFADPVVAYLAATPVAAGEPGEGSGALKGYGPIYIGNT